MATREQAVEIMVEQINIMSRQGAVQQNQDLVELEKALLQAAPHYRLMCGGLYDALLMKGVINPPNA